MTGFRYLSGLNRYCHYPKEDIALNGIAYAMGQAGGASQGGAGGFAQFIPLILMFVIFYYLLIRPQQKKAKEHRKMIDNLKRGERIVTNGGIHGVITGMDETTLTVEIADKVRVKVNRGAVSGLVTSGSQAKAEKPEKVDKKEKK